jgi:para-aminobenzoate synthetase/4-amino-4-deoxychorismate lyase
MFTPPIKSGILNGIMRQKLIDEGKLKEKTISIKELKNADEIYCINSVRGIKKVTLK